MIKCIKCGRIESILKANDKGKIKIKKVVDEKTKCCIYQKNLILNQE